MLFDIRTWVRTIRCSANSAGSVSGAGAAGLGPYREHATGYLHRVVRRACSARGVRRCGHTPVRRSSGARTYLVAASQLARSQRQHRAPSSKEQNHALHPMSAGHTDRLSVLGWLALACPRSVSGVRRSLVIWSVGQIHRQNLAAELLRGYPEIFRECP